MAWIILQTPPMGLTEWLLLQSSTVVVMGVFLWAMWKQLQKKDEYIDKLQKEIRDMADKYIAANTKMTETLTMIQHFLSTLKK